MSYSTFVDDLPKSLKRHIIAYDNLPNHEGCILYLRGGPRKIEVDAHVFDHDHSLIEELLVELVDQPGPAAPIRVSIQKGKLIMLEASAALESGQVEDSASQA